MAYTISVRENVTLVVLGPLSSDLDAVASVFEDMAAAGVNVDMISQSPPQGGATHLSFTTADEDLDKTLEIIARLRKANPAFKSAVSSGNHKLTVYGDAMRSQPGVAATVLRAAASAMADIRLVTTSEVDISLLLTPASADDAAQAVRSALDRLKEPNA